MLSIEAVHGAFDRKQLSVEELTRSLFEAIHADRSNAFLTLCEERAFAQARRCDEILAETGAVPRDRYPLFGVPFGIKDNLAVAGVRMTCASKILEHYVPPYTATAVARLEAAGAVILGKLNMDEFAMGSTSEYSAFGPVKNPVDPRYVAGGSSGGAAAAVRAGLCVAALGTDTGGSVRLPASHCGVVGFKPTYGKVSRSGLVAFASSLDQIGPVTTCVADAGQILKVIAGEDAADSTCSSNKALDEGSQDLRKVRIGIPKEYFSESLSEEVRKAMESAVDWFVSQGAERVEVSLPHSRHAIATYGIVAMSEASSNLARFDGIRFGGPRALFGSEVKRRILLGTFALSRGNAQEYYGRACQVRRLIQRDFFEVYKRVDILLTPVSAQTAPLLNEKVANPLKMYLSDLFTVPANLAGLPAIGIPCAIGAGGLPIGLQLIGRPFADEQLLSVAATFEKGAKNEIASS